MPPSAKPIAVSSHLMDLLRGVGYIHAPILFLGAWNRFEGASKPISLGKSFLSWFCEKLEISIFSNSFLQILWNSINKHVE